MKNAEELLKAFLQEGSGIHESDTMAYIDTGWVDVSLEEAAYLRLLRNQRP